MRFFQIITFLYSILILITPAFADQGLIAKKPYDDVIYTCKKRILYVAVDKTQLTTLESVLTKPWKERVNPKILSQLDSKFVLDKAAEYDIRMNRIKRYFDIKIVDWYDQNILFHPAYRVDRGPWEQLPQGDYESHRWLQFWEWFVHEWDLLDYQENWHEAVWKVRNAIYAKRNKDRKEFIEKLVKDNPEKYEYTEWNCYDIDEIGDCGYYWVHNKEKNEGESIYDLGYIDIAMPGFQEEPESQLCPLDQEFRINPEKVE